MADIPDQNSLAAPHSSGLRTTIDLAVSLAILVSLFRTFLAGGFMIETGSMAPCLLGKHRPAVCPSCSFPFAVEGTGTAFKAVCPNCGTGGISMDSLPENDGDHLLVHRCLYELRPPRRWEVIVFQNPNKLRQAYVKRVVGLPGESVQIRDGDVYISEAIQPKGYATQLGMRIPVYNHDFRPPEDDSEWRPRWVSAKSGGHWQATEGKFRFRAAKNPSSREFEWVHYRHWIRSGGFHVTSQPFAEWTPTIEKLAGGTGVLRYDSAKQAVFCRGALPAETRDRLLAKVASDDSREALNRLYEASHVGPIVDNYGYNQGREGQGNHEVRDLMVALEVRLSAGAGAFAVSITDGIAEFLCVLDRDKRQVRLISLRDRRELKAAALSDKVLGKPMRVELSLMDRQVLVAIDGKLPFDPIHYPVRSDRGAYPRVPVRFGARGAGVEVNSVKLFRDVYYTADVRRRAITAPLTLKSDEYFVLGDNSPVSKDSRSWSDKIMLTSDLLLGKPLVVHLPSRKKRVHLGSWETEFRIPEPSRMRYIH